MRPRNCFLYIHDAVVTQNQLLQYVREVRPGKEWEILDVDTEEVQRIGWRSGMRERKG